jgi:hypothetical protein
LLIPGVRGGTGKGAQPFCAPLLWVTDEPLSGKNATENTANAVALLTAAIIKKTKSTIADDDERFVAGIFVIVFSDYFTLVIPGNFEEASTLAMMKLLGIEEFYRGFDTLWESYNELVRSRPKILRGISKGLRGLVQESSGLGV